MISQSFWDLMKAMGFRWGEANNLSLARELLLLLDRDVPMDRISPATCAWLVRCAFCFADDEEFEEMLIVRPNAVPEIAEALGSRRDAPRTEHLVLIENAAGQLVRRLREVQRGGADHDNVPDAPTHRDRYTEMARKFGGSDSP